jgi:hypothetical protein
VPDAPGRLYSIHFHAWGTFSPPRYAWEAARELTQGALIKLLREGRGLARIGPECISFLRFRFGTWQLIIIVADIYKDDPILYDCPFARIETTQVYAEEALKPKPPKLPKPKRVRPGPQHGTMRMYNPPRKCRCSACCETMVTERARYRAKHYDDHPEKLPLKRRRKVRIEWATTRFL